MVRVYLASPLFTKEERQIVERAAYNFRKAGYEVYVPMEHKIENAWSYPNHEWAKKVFDEDIRAIRRSDIVICLYYGLYSDSGTAWECGYAYGIGKPVRIIDCTEEKDDVSLMIVNGSMSDNLFRDKNQK